MAGASSARTNQPSLSFPTLHVTRTRFSSRRRQRTQVLPRSRTDELRDFGALLKQVLVKFDNLWQMPFPYVMPLHQAPTDGGDYSSFHFHIEFHPPLRRPNLLKYLAGPEIGGGNFLSDTAPEEKAEELRSQPDVHYKHVARELP